MSAIAECGPLRRNLEENLKTWGKGNPGFPKNLQPWLAEQYDSCSFCLEEQIVEV